MTLRMVKGQVDIVSHINDVCKGIEHLVGDDYYDPIKAIDPSHVYYLTEDGFFLFVPKSHTEFDCHVAFKKSGLGRTVELGRFAIEYIKRNYPRCRKLSCEIPVHNRLAVKYSGKLGFRVEGLNARSHMINGSLTDKLILGLEV